MNLRTSTLLLVALLALSFQVQAFSAPLALPGPATTPAESQPPSETPATPVYPGLEQVVPAATELGTHVAATQQNIEKLGDVAEFNKQYRRLKARWDREFAEIKAHGEPKDWPLNRLLNTRAYLGQIEGDIQKLLENIAAPIKSLEAARKEWHGRQLYWQEWQQVLRDSGARIPRETFRDVNGKILDTLNRAEASATQLLSLQQEISSINQQVAGSREGIDMILKALRESPFQKDAFPLFSGDYLRQYQPELLERVYSGIEATFQLRAEFFKRQGLLVLLTVLAFVLALVLLYRFRNIVTDKTDDLHFIFRRPVSAALFISLTAATLFLATPPPLVTLLVSGTAAIAVARLAATLFPEGNQRTLIYTLAGVFALSKTFATIGLPTPLLRLYLCTLSFAAAPFLYWILKRHRRHSKGEVTYYQLLLTAGMIIFAVAFFAELGGYASLTRMLLTALVDSLFVIIFCLMGLRIAEGTLELVFKSRVIGSRRLVKHLGSRAPHRIGRVLKIFILALAGLYLLQTWNIYDDMASAWSTIVGLEFSLGEFHLSVGMVLLTIATLYAATLVSWFFQSFLEAEVFTGRRLDRGVRDAFKKLSHYAIILVAFLTAMTMAGIELKNFAILAGAFGIGIGFGLQEIINNFVSGLILLFERPIKVGDAVIIDGQWGAIVKIGMRSTVVETWDHSEIIVPNSHLISEKVTNWTLSSNISRITIPVGVRYGSDLEKVIAILNQVGDGHPSVVNEPPPSAIFTGFGDSSINFELRVWVDDIKHRLSVISDLGVAIDRAFKHEHIEIPYPQRDLHLRSMSPDIRLFKDPEA